MTYDKDPDRTPYRIVDDDEEEGVRYAETLVPHPEEGDEAITAADVDDVLRGLTITRAGGSYTRADLQANDIMAWHERWETGGATPEEIGVIAHEIASCLGVEVDL